MGVFILEEHTSPAHVDIGAQLALTQPIQS